MYLLLLDLLTIRCILDVCCWRSKDLMKFMLRSIDPLVDKHCLVFLTVAYLLHTIEINLHAWTSILATGGVVGDSCVWPASKG